MEEKKKRGRPVGIPRAETAGRKATGRIRNKTFNFILLYTYLHWFTFIYFLRDKK